MKKNKHISQRALRIKILSPNQIMGSIKPHIVINSNQSTYTLLDANLNEVAVQKQIPFINYIFRGYTLGKFKRQLKIDLKKYKKTCALRHVEPDSKFLKMHEDIIFYLKICPDADYCILELLRKSFQKTNMGYSNYQTACAEYLRELAKLDEGNPSLMPFDINYATSTGTINSNHKYISNAFISFSGDPVQQFKSLMKKPLSERHKYLESFSTYRIDPIHSYLNKSKYKSSRAVQIDER